MANPIAVLAERLQSAIEAALGPEFAGADPVLRRSQNPAFGHFQANAAMALGKRLGRRPSEVAEAIVAELVTDDLIASAEVAGPGFINITLTDEALAAGVTDLDAPRAATPQVVVVDYSAPNVAKEMHVGHLRSTIIGDALARIFEFLGHRVIRQNHLGDWGTPFGMLIEHMIDIGVDEAAHELSVGDLTDFYQAARVKFDGDPAFADRARSRVVALQHGDAATLRLWRVLVDESERYFDAVYDRLRVTLTDADIAAESFYNEWLDDVAAELEAKGIARIDDGALCAFPPGFVGRDGEPLPLIVRKSDGGYGYQCTDLAAIRYRASTLGADRIVYVVDAGQNQHLEMVYAVAGEAGWLEHTRPEHAQFGLVLGTDKKKFRTRSGDNPKLSELLDEAVERAAATVEEKNPELPEAEKAEVAHQVGIGAVKYADLANDRIKDYVFDFDRMLAFEGNTGPYLQYAYARIQSIFRRGEVDEAKVGASVQLGEEPERDLAIELLGFGAAVEITAVTLQPHRLCTYLFDLASAFTDFFEKCPVLRAPDEATRASRLALCAATARVLRTGLNLLGIETPERM